MVPFLSNAKVLCLIMLGSFRIDLLPEKLLSLSLDMEATRLLIWSWDWETRRELCRVSIFLLVNGFKTFFDAMPDRRPFVYSVSICPRYYRMGCLLLPN